MGRFACFSNNGEESRLTVILSMNILYVDGFFVVSVKQARPCSQPRFAKRSLARSAQFSRNPFKLWCPIEFRESVDSL